MGLDLSLFLAETIQKELLSLRALSEERASIERAPGKWSAKEELGHLIDSAANNNIRFVHAALNGEFRGLGNAQDDWVHLHGYRDMPWEAIVNVWFQYNTLLAELVSRIPEDRFDAPCFIGASAAVTLRFVIEDYVWHMQHHIDQILGRELVTQYPGAAKKATI